MDAWAEITLTVAAVVVAAGVIWRKAVIPFSTLVHDGQEVVEKMIPVLRDLTHELADTPDAFAVLDEIIAQFRNDSGSTLRDVVDALTSAAETNRVAIAALVAEASAFRLLAEGDRVQIARLLDSLDRVNVKVDDAADAAASVATNLAAAHDRADAVDAGNAAGEASDAAVRRA